MRAELTDALERQVGQKAATMKGEKRSGLQVHARTGLPCPVCGDTVREVSFADTSGCQSLTFQLPSGWRHAFPYARSSLPLMSAVCWYSRQ